MTPVCSAQRPEGRAVGSSLDEDVVIAFTLRTGFPHSPEATLCVTDCGDVSAPGLLLSQPFLKEESERAEKESVWV